MDNRNKLIMVVGTIALVASSGIGGYLLFTTKDSPSNSPTATSTQIENTAANTSPATTTVTPSSTATPTTSTGFKDGTYTASTNYSVPHGSNTIKATVTINSDKITSVTASGNFTDSESSFYVDSFNSSVNLDASTQLLSAYSPSRIGGASLTTAAFTDVLDTIRRDAKA